nr:hypothetical protein [Tanacetum cinerariifolium]
MALLYAGDAVSTLYEYDSLRELDETKRIKEDNTKSKNQEKYAVLLRKYAVLLRKYAVLLRKYAALLDEVNEGQLIP